MTIVEEIGRRNNWWNDKKKGAAICKALGIEPFIVQSTRQAGRPPSAEVLNFAFMAVLGAIWRDCDDVEMSGKDARKVLLGILEHIREVVWPSVSINVEAGEPRRHVHDATPESVLPATQSSPSYDLAAEWSALYESGILELHEPFSSSPPHAPSHGTWRSPLGQFAMNQKSQSCSINDSTEYALQDLLQVAACSSQAIEEDTGTASMAGGPGEESSSNSMTASLRKRTLAVSEQDAMYSHHQIGAVSKTTKRRHTDTLKAQAALQSLLLAEQGKIQTIPEPDRTDLFRYLECPRIVQIHDPPYVFQFVYLMIGSWQTLSDFAELVRCARASRLAHLAPPPSAKSLKTIYDTICQLENEAVMCTLLKRYHTLQLFYASQRMLLSNNEIRIETPESYHTSSTARLGNPENLKKARVINELTRSVVANVEDESATYKGARSRIKRSLQLGERLHGFTSRFGIGILALLPSGASFSDFSVTDQV